MLDATLSKRLTEDGERGTLRLEFMALTNDAIRVTPKAQCGPCLEFVNLPGSDAPSRKWKGDAFKLESRPSRPDREEITLDLQRNGVRSQSKECSITGGCGVVKTRDRHLRTGPTFDVACAVK